MHNFAKPWFGQIPWSHLGKFPSHWLLGLGWGRKVWLAEGMRLLRSKGLFRAVRCSTGDTKTA